MKRAALVLCLAACHDFAGDLDTCLATGRCACPYDLTFAPVTGCGSGRDLYLAPDGDDSDGGASPTMPRRTLTGVALFPGDHIHLSGTFTQGLMIVGSGSASCPVTIDGDAGFVIGDTTSGLLLNGSFVRLSGLRFEGTAPTTAPLVVIPDKPSIQLSDVLIDAVTVDAAVDLESHIYIQQCTRCTVRGSTFTGVGLVTSAVQTWASEESRLLNNKVTANVYTAAFDLRDHTSLIAGNEIVGHPAARYIYPEVSTGNVFERNLVHDLDGKVAVVGANAVLHNTFVNLGGGTAADMGEFRGNIVSLAGIGLDAGMPASGGYNLFNAVTPYATGGPGMDDLTALPKLDPTSFEPLEGSPAIDAADPNDPVPAGGGTRADIGAIERGAIRLPSGSYCVPMDAGS